MPLRLEPCRHEALSAVAVQHHAPQPRLRHGDLCSSAAAAATRQRRSSLQDGCFYVSLSRKPACRQVAVRFIIGLCSTLHPLRALRPWWRRWLLLRCLLLPFRHGCRGPWARAALPRAARAAQRGERLSSDSQGPHTAAAQVRTSSANKGARGKHRRWRKIKNNCAEDRAKGQKGLQE